MDARLAQLIDDYLSTVSTAVHLLEEAGIPMPLSNAAWAANGIPNEGVLPGGVPYKKHGYGCEVELRGQWVDFDFGRYGETDGFDYFRLSSFANGRLREYGFSGEKDMKACFDRAVEAGALRYSGYVLHYVAEARTQDL